ncbi:uncharacterized protein LOC123715102 [Pieris brassicae]|uniref:uncharacterized protein LOC123715102 n=1 Tax=Pieris brassicae TaxID=7116 RepID=UPI001E6612AD|nr:uncharacterized protein LOC123715102 [Pieris brassicae]
MKLLILLSIVACSYGDKLDRTYLPPANAGSAGGSPGALTAPGLSNFGQTGPATQPFAQPIGQPSRPNSFGQANQQTPGQQESGSLNFESNRPFGFTSGSGARKLSPVYGPADSRPNQGNNGIFSGFGPSNYQGDNQAQSLGISNTPNELGQQPFGPNAASPLGYSQINGQNFVGSSSQPERPQAAADRNAEILSYVNENDGDRFTYRFETSNGITAEETGVASGGVKAQGGYSYTGDDGKSYTITYTADEQGYQPQGEHLPTPPPIPEEILKSIEKNAQAAAAGTQEGAYRPEDYENEDNSQGYSGATSINKPQGQDQFSSQQYTVPLDKPARSQIGLQQTKPELQNVLTSEDSYKDRLTNGVSSFDPIRSSNQNVGSTNQAQSQRRPGYEYSRPQKTQANKQAFGSQSGQSGPQFSSQIPSNSPFSKSGNGQDLNRFNGVSRPESQRTPSGQDYFKPSQLSQYQQSGFKSTSNQPGQGPQSQSPQGQNYNQEASDYQYQPVKSGFGVTARPSIPNQPSLQNQVDQGVTPQDGNQYQTNPLNKFSNRPSSNKPGSSLPSFNRPTQDQGSKPVFPSANQPEQFSGPRQPPSYNPEEGYKY